MKKHLLTLTVLTLFGLQARAAGGYQCAIEDQNLNFKIGGVLSHGMPTGPFQNYGELKLKDENLGKVHDLEQIKEPSQFWQYGKDLKVLVYNESEKANYHTAMTLVIETRYCESCEEETHKGNYKLTIFNANDSETLNFSGKVNCFVE